MTPNANRVPSIVSVRLAVTGWLLPILTCSFATAARVTASAFSAPRSGSASFR